MYKKLLLILALAAAFSGVGLVVHQGQAAAFYGCDISYTYDPTHRGYFTNGLGSAPCNVLPYPALTKVNSYNSFVAYMGDYLNQANSQGENLSTSDKWIAMVGAAFIIDKMLGIDQGVGNVGQGINDARANFNNWKARVLAINNDPSAGTGIDWNYTPSYSAFCNGTTNSAYSPDIGDDVMYPTVCPWDYNHSLPEIRLFWAGGSFEIGKQCGNVELTFKPLPTNHLPSGTLKVQCDAAAGVQTATATISDADASTTGYVTIVGTSWRPTLKSGTTLVTSIPQSDAPPYNSVAVELWANDSGPLGTGKPVRVASVNTVVPCAKLACGGLNASVDQIDPYMHFNLTVTVTNNTGSPPPGATIDLQIAPPAGATYSYSGSAAASGSGSVSSATFNNLGPTNNTGRFTASWSLGSQNCSGTFDVVNLPYLNIYGGDAMGGASPDYGGGSSSCAVDSDGGLYGWNNYTSGYSGAGAQFAVQALGAITGFASAHASSNTDPDGLSFANTYAAGGATKDDPSQGLYGGYFSDPTGGWTGSCDFTSDIKSSPVSGNVTISATTIAVGANAVRYVTNGDVYISGDITYAGAGGWATLSDIPSFKLVVVGGDIYIGSGVTNLDGLYVSESSGGNGGNIYTCASGPSTAVTPTTANYFTTCHKQLVIHGAFVARQVQFGRTYGSLGQAGTDTAASNHDAEVFYYSPELWLPRASSLPDGGYAAITGLPPVL